MDVILKQMEHLGFDNLKEHIVSKTIVTPDDWASRDIYKGAVFNLAHGLDQMLWRRPQNKFEELEKLYLVGGGTHPGSGLPTILESGRISAKMICADLGIDPDWNGMDLVRGYLYAKAKIETEIGENMDAYDLAFFFPPCGSVLWIGMLVFPDHEKTHDAMSGPWFFLGPILIWWALMASNPQV